MDKEFLIRAQYQSKTGILAVGFVRAATHDVITAHMCTILFFRRLTPDFTVIKIPFVPHLQ